MFKIKKHCSRTDKNCPFHKHIPSNGIHLAPWSEAVAAVGSLTEHRAHSLSHSTSKNKLWVWGREKAMVPGVPETFPFQVVSGALRHARHSRCQEKFHGVTLASSWRRRGHGRGFHRRPRLWLRWRLALATHLLLSPVLRFHVAHKSFLSLCVATSARLREFYSNRTSTGPAPQCLLDHFWCFILKTVVLSGFLHIIII